MRRSRADTAATRSAIVAAASRLFRSNGIAAVSVADVMGSLGLTVGGFYRHFASKDALVAEAITFASEETTTALSGVRDRATPGARLQAVADFYLSRAHRENRGYGCPVAAFAGEVTHSSGIVRQAFADAHSRLAAVVADADEGDMGDGPSGEPRLSVPTLVGALLLGRALDADISVGSRETNLDSAPARRPSSHGRARRRKPR